MYSCCCVEANDYEYPSISDVKMVKARVHHTCTECGDLIKPGERYERADLLHDGEWLHYKTCWFCLCVRSDFFDCGWLYGCLVEEFAECNGWDYREMPATDGDVRVRHSGKGWQR